jgi:hydrogenase expression/formation protein HypD
MKHVEEYRDPKAVEALAAKIRSTVTKPWTIMEVCGGQTHSIVRFGIDELLPDEITLVHGPGCPVCVTGVELIDKAIAVARKPDVIFTSFGDMLRVPGSEMDLLSVKAEGRDVRLVYSPLDALRLARENIDREVVFFSVGFETTAPTAAMALAQAKQAGVKNFSLLTAHVLVPPAIEAIMTMDGTTVQGFLAAGHVCTIMGTEEYTPLAKRFGIPIAVTGFEPVDILQGVLSVVEQLEAGKNEVTNPYSRVVRPEGNVAAKKLLGEVFTVVDRTWRGIGDIPGSGWGLSETYREFDAELKFDLSGIISQENSECISGQILQGVKKPPECPLFGTTCTPEHPLGATMVSSEGACAAYYKYRLHSTESA